MVANSQICSRDYLSKKRLEVKWKQMMRIFLVGKISCPYYLFRLDGMNKDDSDEVPPGISLGHSWADVEQFLLEQEQQSISDESTPQF